MKDFWAAVANNSDKIEERESEDKNWVSKDRVKDL